jgi:hypothetical protein
MNAVKNAKDPLKKSIIILESMKTNNIRKERKEEDEQK